MGTFNGHLVSITQNPRCNHGDDAMPCGRIAIKQYIMEMDRL